MPSALAGNLAPRSAPAKAGPGIRSRVPPGTRHNRASSSVQRMSERPYAPAYFCSSAGGIEVSTVPSTMGRWANGQMGMIVVSGKVTVLSGNMDEALKVSQEHVVRSRSEAGYTSHGASVNAEAATQLIFLEQWENLASLKSHFVVPESPTFATAISKLASTPQRFQFFCPRKSSLTPREQEMSQHAE